MKLYYFYPKGLYTHYTQSTAKRVGLKRFA